MTYAEITTSDRNPLKRKLQGRRLDDVVQFVKREKPLVRGSSFMDFGSGDGELSLRIANKFPGVKIACFEPSPKLRKEAEQKLRDFPDVKVSHEVTPGSTYDVIACCEVFEHLTADSTAEALSILTGSLKMDGRLLIGVPNEIFLVALAKGVFRMRRRYGEYDARWDTVLAAAKGKPRPDRPVLDLDGLPFIFPHTGFDYRLLVRSLAEFGLRVENVFGSPFRSLPVAVNSEVYIACSRSK